MMNAHEITLQLGGSWHGDCGNAPCPVCQPESRKDQNALSILQIDGKLLLNCFKSHCSFVEIARAISLPLVRENIDSETRTISEQKQIENSANKRTRARYIWNSTIPISGTVAENYLRSRGINVPLPDSLRFLPHTYHAPSSTRACALVANVEPTGGIHRTYFHKQGIRLPVCPKMMLGPCSGGAVRLSNGNGPLVVCEGLETGLSLVQMLSPQSPEVWAALSTGAMKSLTLPTLPRDLIVATDGEEAGRSAGSVLASRATALGWAVSSMPAPEGQDWNDVLVQS